MALLAIVCLALAAAPRPLKIADANSWNAIISQQLSPDGKFLAYGLYPQEGDGFVIVRNLTTGHDYRFPGGMRPPAGPQDPERESPAPPPVITILYSSDSRTLCASTFPPKAEVDAAKKAKKKPEAMPKNSLLLVDLATGTPTSIPRVKSFQLGEEAGRTLAYLREPEPPAPAKDEAKAEAKEEKDKKETPTADLILRNLDTGAQRTFPGVSEFTLAKDGATVVYAAPKEGVFAIQADAAPTPILPGKGKATKLTWDRLQKRLVFVSEHDKAENFKLYLWSRDAATATEIVSPATPGFRPDWTISEKGALAFSPDSTRLFLATAPVRAKAPKPDPDAERSVFDLWHWKSDYIPPMQKVRFARERDRSYRAVYELASHKFLQLADPTLADLTPADQGRFAIATDDRAYRRSTEYATRRADAYLVDITTGDRTRVGQELYRDLSFSPDGRYLVGFDNKQWYTIAVPSGTRTVLTANLGVNFYNELSDSPENVGPYGSGGWTRDSKWLILYDRFDVWAVSPDGATARNLTAGQGRTESTQLRIVRFPKNADDKWLDPTAPLLLRAENLETYDTGFWQVPFDSSTRPEKLLMGAKNYTAPSKARKAPVFLFTASTFEEVPDLLVAGPTFQNARKVSDANPQRKDFLWGTSELMHFRNADGVPLKAALFKPANFDPSRKYPLIVYLYERMSQTVRSFIDPKPMHIINPSIYASNGYVILMPDIVYTVGYPGQSALKCVIPAVNALVAQGYIDEKAIGIQGHSWGGYQIAYMVTQTNMFRAAAAGAIVSNMVSAYDGIRWGPGLPRQFQYEHQQSRIGGSLWEFPERYIANSAIFQADRVTTPMLLLHNDADDAVPWYQGIEFFLALRRLGKEAYMVNYNGELHGPRKRVNAKDYAQRLENFFNTKLKGAPEPEWMSKGIPYTRP